MATKALRHEEFSDWINDSTELVEVKIIVIKQKSSLSCLHLSVTQAQVLSGLKYFGHGLRDTPHASYASWLLGAGHGGSGLIRAGQGYIAIPPSTERTWPVM